MESLSIAETPLKIYAFGVHLVSAVYTLFFDFDRYRDRDGNTPPDLSNYKEICPWRVARDAGRALVAALVGVPLLQIFLGLSGRSLQNYVTCTVLCFVVMDFRYMPIGLLGFLPETLPLYMIVFVGMIHIRLHGHDQTVNLYYAFFTGLIGFINHD